MQYFSRFLLSVMVFQAKVDCSKTGVRGSSNLIKIRSPPLLPYFLSVGLQLDLPRCDYKTTDREQLWRSNFNQIGGSSRLVMVISCCTQCSSLFMLRQQNVKNKLTRPLQVLLNLFKNLKVEYILQNVMINNNLFSCVVYMSN